MEGKVESQEKSAVEANPNVTHLEDDSKQDSGVVLKSSFDNLGL